ncbi:FAD-binding oxidoreductase [Natronosporangium hydrolyticum]|uniref:FAD-binding oxidoreductase n=1 Tax=Natronosporangium hydrolyticum TaxID=2811111 RepID=A0A895YB15_9ACTN|nr:FAD-binding oxidoreductase [Natronosporangium hydrolyticum]QSB14937.1 FAD-binding oxidoreductase [Natronosporangium hydrolyticum]
MSSQLRAVVPATVDEDGLAAALRANLHGEVIDRAHPEYDRARQVWNGLIDRYPAVIARCTGAADVVAAVGAAREFHPPVSIRGGGHQIAGSAVCDNGLVIDLSPMKGVAVDPIGHTLRAGGGVTWGELDREAQLFGLATTGGEVSTTGIAGFTLGGGMGLLMRAYGLACDNLRSAEIVTADGMVRTASRQEHQDLFWALRGGGRGLGVVTGLEYDLHPLGPQVATAQVFYPYEAAAQLLRGWSDVVRALPETITPQLALWSVPPDPALPAELHWQRAVMVAGISAGPAESGAATLAPLRELAEPLLDLSGLTSYLEIQSAVDPLFPAGGRYYMKSHFMADLPEPAIEAMLAQDARRPTPESLIVIRSMGGAVARVGADETAFPHRSEPFNVSIDAGWVDPALDATAVGWARDTWRALVQYASGGVYVNFSGFGEEADELRDAVFGGNQRRLAEVRAAYDPAGLFDAASRRP